MKFKLRLARALYVPLIALQLASTGLTFFRTRGAWAADEAPKALTREADELFQQAQEQLK